jgi:hypothetical protein
MRIDRTERVAGQPILRVREYLRRSRRPIVVTKDGVARWFKVSDRKAAEILRELKARSWVERLEGKFGRQGYYELTMKGNAFTAASAIPPMTRDKAERLLADFLKRVEGVNARDELTHYVHEVHVFGSYLKKKAKDLGDRATSISRSLCACVRSRAAIPATTLRYERMRLVAGFNLSSTA